MKKYSLVLIPSVLAMAGTFAMGAQTLKDKSGMEADRKGTAETAKRINATCGTNIKVSVDYPSYIKGAGSVDEYSHAPYQYCQNAADAVDLTCRHSAAGKEAVQQKIKSITCSYGTSEAESLDGTDLHYTIGYHGGNSDSVYKWLGDHL